MAKILNYNDVMKISSFLINEGYADYDITIETKVEDERMLNMVDEEFFYRTSDEKNRTDRPKDWNAITVNVGGIHFSYSINEDN